MRFSEKLPKLRKNNNLSQEQLAEQLGVSRQASFQNGRLAIPIQIWKKCYKCAKY